MVENGAIRKSSSSHCRTNASPSQVPLFLSYSFTCASASPFFRLRTFILSLAISHHFPFSSPLPFFFLSIPSSFPSPPLHHIFFLFMTFFVQKYGFRFFIFVSPCLTFLYFEYVYLVYLPILLFQVIFHFFYCVHLCTHN